MADSEVAGGVNRFCSLGAQQLPQVFGAILLFPQDYEYAAQSAKLV